VGVNIPITLCVHSDESYQEQRFREHGGDDMTLKDQSAEYM